MKNNVKKHLIYIAIIIGLVTLYHLLDVTCPILYLTHIPCPTCGVTRALVCLMKFDFAGYMYYHPFAVPLVIAVMFALHIKLFKKEVRWLPFTFVMVTLVANLVLYGFRLHLYIESGAMEAIANLFIISI